MFTAVLTKSTVSFGIDVHVTANFGGAFLKYDTPFDAEIMSCRSFNVFDITNEMSPVPLEFTGAVAKRLSPTRDHFVSMHAGQTLSSMVDISKCFEFVEGRKYLVQLNAETDTMIGTESAGSQLLKSQELHFVAPKTSVAPKLQGNTALFGGRKLFTVGYDSACTSSQQSTTATAISNALSGVNTAYNPDGTGTLQKGCAGADYVELFGTYDMDRYNTVVGNYQRIQDRLASASFNINCGDCASTMGNLYSSTYAYVYPSDSSHTIYLCGSYWNSPTTLEVDSKPGTLIHELSHFDDVAGTDDNVYGLAGCRSLAISSPCAAVNNADSHEYYIELIPTLDSSCCGHSSSSCSESYCAINQGQCDVAAISSGPACSSSTSFTSSFTSSCLDDPTWLDSMGYSCADYADNFNWCSSYSTTTSSQGMLVTEACCACGGGSYPSSSSSLATSADPNAMCYDFYNDTNCNQLAYTECYSITETFFSSSQSCISTSGYSWAGTSLGFGSIQLGVSCPDLAVSVYDNDFCTGSSQSYTWAEFYALIVAAAGVTSPQSSSSLPATYECTRFDRSYSYLLWLPACGRDINMNSAGILAPGVSFLIVALTALY